MIPSQLLPLANHLWQTTLFAAGASLLTLLLRKNRARVRFWLWLSASLKFVLPFSILVDVGGRLGRHTATTIASSARISAASLSSAIGWVGEPFTMMPAQLALPEVHWSYTRMTLAVFIAVWTVGFALLVYRWTARWRRVRASVRTASSLSLPIGLAVKSSPAFGEPGVFGILRPTLLLPDGVVDCLTAGEMDAIVAHELCHVRRRDNLATAIHMVVESLFWFHPLVWWVGARLMEERERACDEEVLRTGGDPHAYAEGILKVCELYLTSPLACVPGVTGGNLKRRIEKIMAKQVARNLSLGGKMLLVASAVVAFGGPAAIGVLSVQPGRSQTQTGAVPSAFEAASVKLHEGGISRGQRGQTIEPGRLTWFNTTLGQLIETAYSVKHYQVSGPDWIVNWGSTDRYDVMATTGKPVSADEIKRMLGPLLAERFHLTFHRETREMPVFALVVAKGGPKLQPGDDGGPSQSRDSDGGWFHKNWSMTMLAGWLSGLASVGQPVIDHTGMQGTYSFHENLLNFPKVGSEETKAEVAARIEQPDDSLFSTLQRTLGLRVEAQKAQIEILIIDQAEKVPTEN